MGRVHRSICGTLESPKPLSPALHPNGERMSTLTGGSKVPIIYNLGPPKANPTLSEKKEKRHPRGGGAIAPHHQRT